MSSRLPILVASAVAVCAGCGYPHDPEGTFQRVRGRTLRVGITTNQPWTHYDDHRAHGIEAELIKAFARELGADIDWTHDSESNLFEALRQGNLNLVIGGIRDSSPWASYVGLTQPYVTVGGQKHVMAVHQGENRWLLELERFLRSRRSLVECAVAAAQRRSRAAAARGSLIAAGERTGP